MSDFEHLAAIKAEMKTSRLDTKIEANNEKFEVLRENIWTSQEEVKTPFLCCSADVAMETCLFAKQLLRNDCCIIANFAVIA
jgi:hypothetical protein